MNRITQARLRIIRAVTIADQPFSIWERLKAADDALVEINAMRRELMTMQKGEAGMAGKRNGEEGDI